MPSNSSNIATALSKEPSVTQSKVIASPKPNFLPTTSIALAGSDAPAALQVLINANWPLASRPIVALSVAVLTDTAIDLELISDHRIRHNVMGLENGEGVVTGDLAMARYIARRAKDNKILGSSDASKAKLESWVDYALSLQSLQFTQKLAAVTLTLEHALSDQTYLQGHNMTIADLSLFWAIGFPTQASDLSELLRKVHVKATSARRWIKTMAKHPSLLEATQLCIGVANNNEVIIDARNIAEPLVPGMHTLEGGVTGKVVTRFPPEPSGYLHIGHAKAVLLNDYYAKRYRGRLIARFDDTNPSKEKEEFQESIIADLAKLAVRPNLITFTSDYFKTIEGYARYMMANGFAYMDDTPQEQMKIERGERKNSKHRNQSPDDAIKFFELMCSGSEEGGKWCLRAKIDMNSDNGTLRDPVLYRQNLEPHHRSGTSYKAYPTYDLACPIVDSIEGVTHALRTTEYDDRNAQYQWIQKILGIRRVRVHTFSRVNFKNTVLSKRKLTWFVENGTVTGWDDPRFPTVRGVVRRGINIQALRNFMYSQGASRRIVLMDWMVFWSENKKEIDKEAKRFMAVNTKDKIVHLNVINGPSQSDFSYFETSLHPKNPYVGKRVVRICSSILLETVDVEGIQVGEDIVLMRWGVVRITKVEPKQLEGEFIPDGDFKSAKRKLSWLADVPNNIPVTLVEFDNLISKEKLEEDDNFQDYINPNTLASTEVIGDAALKSLVENEVIQLERRGYYRVDRPYISSSKPLILFMIPDGKSKAMSGQTGKLAHR